MIYLRRPGQPYARNEAGSQVDHPFIDSRQMGVRVEHETSIGEEKGNVDA